MKTFDQYMAESGRQSELDSLRASGQEGAARAQYESSGSYGGGGSGGGGSAYDVMMQMQNELAAKMEELGNRFKQYETDNPFTFDELLAQQSAEERLSPYYEAELSDFVKGVTRQRETIGGERDLLTQLNTLSSGAAARNLDQAVKASGEGYAGKGMFFSGERESQTGLQKVGAAEQAKQRELQLGRSMGSLANQELGVQQGEDTYRRQWGAEKQTALTTDIEQQKQQERAQWEAGRMEYLGPEFMGNYLNSGGLDSWLAKTFGA